LDIIGVDVVVEEVVAWVGVPVCTTIQGGGMYLYVVPV
jgi:hypothetical protein